MHEFPSLTSGRFGDSARVLLKKDNANIICSMSKQWPSWQECPIEEEARGRPDREVDAAEHLDNDDDDEEDDYEYGDNGFNRMILPKLTIPGWGAEVGAAQFCSSWSLDSGATSGERERTDAMD